MFFESETYTEVMLLESSGHAAAAKAGVRRLEVPRKQVSRHLGACWAGLLVASGVQVSLQGAALRCRCPVVGNINGVELGLGDPTECLGPSLNGLGACRPFAVPVARVDAHFSSYHLGVRADDHSPSLFFVGR